jgi:beta-glucanase (GH16 family)
MALLKLKLSALKIFGKFPKTQMVEAKDKALREEFDEYNRFAQSQELKHYLELKEFAGSGEPERTKAELHQLKYKGSIEHGKEQDFIRLSKDRAIQNYFKVQDSPTLNKYKSIELTGKPTRFEELQQIVESADYKSNRSIHKKENSDEYQKELEFKKLKQDHELKEFFKLKRWKPLNDFFHLDGSETIEKYLELKEYINSQEFIARKAYLLSKDKYEQSDSYKKVQEYKNLKKSDKIVWHHSLENTKKFDDIKRWELVFSDDFSKGSLSPKHWITRYFWGDALINKSYSLAADRHCYNEDKNIEIVDSTLKIITQKEKSEGIAWDLKYGFIPKTFDYTSGIISSGQAFRQKYGRFQAKIKFTSAPGVYHAFWLVGETMLPHIDIFRQKGKDNSSIQGSIFWQNGSNKKPNGSKTSVGGFDFKNEYYILSLDWTPNKMIWKINGIPFKEVSSNLPDVPTYMVLSSGVVSETDETLLPASLEVDWVRCWKEKEIVAE